MDVIHRSLPLRNDYIFLLLEDVTIKKSWKCCMDTQMESCITGNINRVKNHAV